MFTGIIESVGKVVEFRRPHVWIELPWRLALGDSLAVDGVCLTVSAMRGKRAQFEVGPQTLKLTTLGSLRVGSGVNVERALRVGDRLGGHWVTGHVEAKSKILSLRPADQAWWLKVAIPKALRPAVIDRGSLAVDGISLTVAQADATAATIMVIHHTWTHTTLSTKRAGDDVNLETDLLARYALQRNT